MKELTEYIARSLVDQPDKVIVSENKHGRHVNLELQVGKEDMGRIIGRGGRVANAIRTLLRVAAENDNQQVTLDVVEP
ncbi:MAG TPA: KH domain-containing protein [Anaerolineales bacterium]|nr:KH domain-containing protein [Anaerolineales bacterium]